MEAWLTKFNGKYKIVYATKKPVIGETVIAKVGDAVWQFSPGFVYDDLVFLKLISAFKIDEQANNVTYILKDQQGNLAEVNSNNIGHISPLLNWLYTWIFTKKIINLATN